MFSQIRRRQTTANRHPLFQESFSKPSRDLILPVLLHPHHHKLNAGELPSESSRDLIRRKRSQRTLPNKTVVDREGSDDADLKAGRSP
ncbi:hypothetical protein Bca52824_094222 [Brassica carinata]|uniref:Uncharacterized protein n=1 Tax=Brassica carinata TaxID=52824 RepID=A0A8X7P409_BRACI|nr:hypothetical protein Bca52824_094222 [Brassica carinata]